MSSSVNARGRPLLGCLFHTPCIHLLPKLTRKVHALRESNSLRVAQFPPVALSHAAWSLERAPQISRGPTGVRDGVSSRFRCLSITGHVRTSPWTSNFVRRRARFELDGVRSSRSPGARCLGLAHQAAKSCETWHTSSLSRPGSISVVSAHVDAWSTRVESFFIDDGRTRRKKGKTRRGENF